MTDTPAGPAPRPLFVICDRCRAAGLAGDDPFEQFGALLDFDPVPRKSERADGWSAEVQRSYIAALSLTGNDRAACRAVGKSAFGVKQLLAHEGSEGFRAAREQALEMAADERGRRLAEGVRAVADDQARWSPPAPPWAHAETRRGPGRPPHRPIAALPPPDEPPNDQDEAEILRPLLGWLGEIVNKYYLKVHQERTARLEGRIVEADFYLRQLSWLEVVIDLGSGDGVEYMRDHREAGSSFVDIAETPMSRILGEVRRRAWADAGEPERPEHPPREHLVDHGRFSTEPQETTRGGLAQSHEEQKSAFEERHRRAAEAQVEWEAEARRDYERRRASAEAHEQEPGSAGRPAGAAAPDRTDDPSGEMMPRIISDHAGGMTGRIDGFTPVTAPEPEAPEPGDARVEAEQPPPNPPEERQP